MTISQEDLDDAKGTLIDGENVLVTARQRKFGPGMAIINPTVVVATDRRLILINRTTLGIRKDIESIPYGRITSIRFENGLISASVYVRIEGYTSSQGETGFLKPGMQEGEIFGLTKGDAKALTDVIDGIITRAQPVFGPSQPQQQPPPQKICKKCGTANNPSAKFCEKCGAQLR